MVKPRLDDSWLEQLKGIEIWCPNSFNSVKSVGGLVQNMARDVNGFSKYFTSGRFGHHSPTATTLRTVQGP